MLEDFVVKRDILTKHPSLGNISSYGFKEIAKWKFQKIN